MWWELTLVAWILCNLAVPLMLILTFLFERTGMRLMVISHYCCYWRTLELWSDYCPGGGLGRNKTCRRSVALREHVPFVMKRRSIVQDVKPCVSFLQDTGVLMMCVDHRTLYSGLKLELLLGNRWFLCFRKVGAASELTSVNCELCWSRFLRWDVYVSFFTCIFF